MRKGIGPYRLVFLERDDEMFKLPVHWKENNEEIIRQLERIDGEIRTLREEIERIKKFYME